ERRRGAELAAKFCARRLELAALAADAARPRIAAQRVDHRAAHAPLGEGFELDPAGFVETERGVDQAEDAILHEIAQLDGMRHRRGDAARQRFDERNAGGNAFTLTGGEGLTLHEVGSPWPIHSATATPGGKRKKSVEDCPSVSAANLLV